MVAVIPYLMHQYTDSCSASKMGKQNTLPRGQSLFQVVGRFVPNQKYGEDDPQCKVYRMKIFAKNKVVARSRFWYFMGRLCRVKKANGQIVSVNQVSRARPARTHPARSCRTPHAASRRSSRRPQRRSKTLASGSVTIRGPVRTTPTRSTVSCADGCGQLPLPKHGGPQPGQGGQLPDPAHLRAQGQRVQAAEHCSVPHAKDQVPAGAPHHQDAEGLQDHLQGVLREDLLRLGGCTALLVSCASSGV